MWPLVSTSILLVCVSTSLAVTCDGFGPKAATEARVANVEGVRGGRLMTDVTKASVVWNPEIMLDDINCYDLEKTQLLYSTDPSEELRVAEVPQSSAGANSKWDVDLMPCLKYQFAIRVVPLQVETEASTLILPQTVGPVDQSSIIASDFKPNPVSDLMVTVGAAMANLEWKPSLCSNLYDVTWAKEGESNTLQANIENPKLELNELESCTTYDIEIFAKLSENEGYSDGFKSKFATKPRLDAMEKVGVEVSEVTLNSAIIKWDVYDHVSCISSYDLQLCQKNDDDQVNCDETFNVKKKTSVAFISHTLDDLDTCTTYELTITPLYEDITMEQKVISFRTRSPDASQVSVAKVDTEVVSANQMKVWWPQVKCAISYNVYQKQIDEEDNGGEWDNLGSVSSISMTADNLTPCQTYVFAVTAVLDDTETSKTEGLKMTSELDENSRYEPPNLNVNNSDRMAKLSWDHASCIDSYKISVCEPAYTCPIDDIDQSYINTEAKNVEFTLTELTPCSHYSVTLMPVIGSKVFEKAMSFNVTTTNGTPEIPKRVEIEYNKESFAASLKWNPTPCSTGYNVSLESGSRVKWFITEKNAHKFEDLVNCQTYKFQVSSLVGEQESALSQPTTLAVPPDVTRVPDLRIVSNEKDNVTLKIEPSKINAQCVPLKYELHYSSSGSQSFETETFDASKVVDNDGDIKLAFEGASEPGFIVRARILYSLDPEQWSEWVSSEQHDLNDASEVHALSSSQVGLQSLLPIIVVGIVLALVVVAVIVFVLVRGRNKSSRAVTLDHEKGMNKKAKSESDDDEERRKLNEEDHNNANE